VEDLNESKKKEFPLPFELEKKCPYYGHLGIAVVDVDKGFAKLRMPFSEKLTHSFGFLHGGAIASLADAAVANAVLTLIESDERIAAIEVKCNFLIAVGKGTLTAEAKIIHKGFRTAVGEVNIWDSEYRLVAKAIATYAIMR
jgi:acyl-CoA thioesterase